MCSRVLLQEGLSEARKVKPELWWRPKDVGYARAVRHLPQRAAQEKERCMSQAAKMKEESHLGPLKLKPQILDMELQDLMLGVSVLLWSKLCSLCAYSFWDGNVYPMPLYVESSAETVKGYVDIWSWTKCILHHYIVLSLWRPEEVWEVGFEGSQPGPTSYSPSLLPAYGWRGDQPASFSGCQACLAAAMLTPPWQTIQLEHQAKINLFLPWHAFFVRVFYHHSRKVIHTPQDHKKELLHLSNKG